MLINEALNILAMESENGNILFPNQNCVLYKHFIRLFEKLCCREVVNVGC